MGVLGFDGAGQGGALRQGIFFTHAWEKFAKAVLHHFGLSELDWLGASCGGYLALRAAAFEPRIKHVISKAPEHLKEHAADLVRLKLDLIVVTTGVSGLVAKGATTTIPIVMATKKILHPYPSVRFACQHPR